MTSHTSTGAVHNDDAGRWRILADLKVSGGPGSEAQAVEQVVAVGQSLNWPPANVAQLRLTISLAIKSVLAREPQPGSLAVRVFVRQRGETAGDSSPLNIETHNPAGNGWGFFLVQKSAEDSALPAGERQEAIELFFYQE